MEDVESQRKGLVFVVWPGPQLSMPSAPGPRDHVEFQRVFESSPMRIVALHICFPDTPIYRLIRSVFAVGLGAQLRQRLKFHS
jgi:hypothetical protein